ncbi:rubrerythrin [Thermococcus sp. P6]|uniref:DUF835 domain-containing protein n=1 Tax=Thermococcus sp. P6 TaxID=122420 RepID=UPI000B59EB69|nr:DUF835 domain-containing protein [Thermococcus sp. P6]ASJ11086.1 rubrerythrin [Thermococcus sp. P6]
MESDAHLRKIMEEIVEKLRDRSPKELLSYAIFNERDEVNYYRKLAEKARKASIKALFIKMSEESKNHHDWLYDLFKKLYPSEEPVKVDAPPVEVEPFYPEFETVEDYISALEYCMESELFAKKTYELLAEVSMDEETRAFALSLAIMEEEHYREIRRMYELMLSLREENIQPSSLEPGGYLFTDETKARYFLIDLASAGVKLYALIREDPERFLKPFKGSEVRVLWLTNIKAPGAVPPEGLPVLKKDLCRFIAESGGAVFIQNLGYVASELGFRDTMDLVIYLKDCAILHRGYLIATALEEAFERREWALITSELRRIS